MAKVCNFDEYLGPKEFRNKVGPTPRAHRKWRCGKCTVLNKPWLMKCWGCGTTKGVSQS